MKNRNRMAMVMCAALGIAAARCGDSGSSGGGDGSFANRLCDLDAECISMDSEERDGCEQYFQDLYRTTPSPSAFIECYQAADCNQRIVDYEITVPICANLNPDANECLSSTRLRLCDYDGVCKTLDCTWSCESDLSAGETLADVDCSPSVNSGNDVCQCYIE